MFPRLSGSRTHGEYFGGNGRHHDPVANGAEQAIEQDEQEIQERLSEIRESAKTAKQTKKQNGVPKVDQEAFFMSLFPRDAVVAAQKTNMPEEQALQLLRKAVPPEGPVPWSSSKALLPNDYFNEAMGNDPSLRRHQTLVVQLHAGLQRVLPPETNVFQKAVWKAAARPPWIGPIASASEPLTLVAWGQLLRAEYGVVPLALIVLHRLESTQHVRAAYICDWMVESINACLAVILDSRGPIAEGLTAEGAIYATPATVDESDPAMTMKWAYVSTTLGDCKLVDLIDNIHRRLQGVNQ